MYPTGYEGSKIQNVVSFGRHPRRPGGIDSGKTSRFSDEVCNRISPQPTAHTPTPTPTVSLAANSCRRPPLHLSLAADVRRARTHVCCAVECRVSICLKNVGHRRFPPRQKLSTRPVGDRYTAVESARCGWVPTKLGMAWWRGLGKTRLGSAFFWEVLRRNPGRMTVLCLIGIQTVFGESNGPNVKQRAAQRSQHHG